MEAHQRSLGCLAIAIITAAAATAAPRDASADEAQLWTEAGLRYRFHEQWALGFTQQVRFDQDVSRLDGVLPELGVGYRPVEWLRLSTGYRYMYERDNAGDMQSRHRVHFDVRPRLRLESVDLWYRARYQLQLRKDADNGTPVRNAVRNQLGAQYRGWEVVRPFVSTEAFVRVDDPGSTVEFKKLRCTAGTELNFDPHRVEVFYRLEVLQADTADPTLHIIGLGYRYDL